MKQVPIPSPPRLPQVLGYHCSAFCLYLISLMALTFFKSIVQLLCRMSLNLGLFAVSSSIRQIRLSAREAKEFNSRAYYPQGVYSLG